MRVTDFSFRSGELELRFLGDQRGVALASIYDHKQNGSLLSSPCPLFTLTAERLSGGESLTVASDKDFLASDVMIDETVCTIVFSG